MREIKAIIQPFMLEKVLEALDALGDLPGLTVSQVVGWGRSHGMNPAEPAHEASHAFAKKTKLEIVVADDMAPLVVETIMASARTGKAGDGKIFVCEVKEVVRIRTGEKNSAAI